MAITNARIAELAESQGAKPIAVQNFLGSLAMLTRENALANLEQDARCLACGELVFGDCEPDARNYPCESCDKRRVYGAEEARLIGALEVTEASE